MITMFLSKRTQCLYYSLETGNTKMQAVHTPPPPQSPLTAGKEET